MEEDYKKDSLSEENTIEEIKKDGSNEGERLSWLDDICTRITDINNSLYPTVLTNNWKDIHSSVVDIGFECFRKYITNEEVNYIKEKCDYLQPIYNDKNFFKLFCGCLSGYRRDYKIYNGKVSKKKR